MGQFDSLVGELTPGKSGWLPLDESGVPSGPATLLPPSGPNAVAAYVYSPSKGRDKLLSGTGAPLIPPLNANVDKRVYAVEVPPLPLVLSSISPSSAVIGSADVVLHAIGSGFTPDSVIVFNGGDETTVYVSDTEVTTIVKPSLASVAISVPVLVRNGDLPSGDQIFTFISAQAAAARSKK